MDNSPDLIQVYDIHGNCLYTSPSSRTLLGYPPEHFEATNIFDRMEGTPAAEALQSYQTTIRNPGKPLRLHNKFQHADGPMLEMEASVTLIPGLGPEGSGVILAITRVSSQ